MASQKPKTTAPLAFLGSASKAAEAFFHIVPVPYVGTRFKASSIPDASSAILQASLDMETWDGRSVPARHGVHTHAAVDCKGKAEAVMGRVAEVVSGIVKQEKFPIGLGGDGSITYGMVKGFLDAGFESIGVIHIDAQADLRDEDAGESFSDATVMKRIVDEDVALFQLGVRSLSKEEADARKVNGVKYYDADFLVSRNINKIELPGEFPEAVFLSIDVDGFDPSVFPSPGAHPGGLGWWQVLSIVESITQQVDIVGMDLTEFGPVAGQPLYDQSAAQLIYRIMGMVERARL